MSQSPRPLSDIDRQTLEAIAEAAAERAVARAFGNLGLDPSSPSEIREFHADQLWTRNARTGASKIKVTLFGSILTALVFGIWTLISRSMDSGAP